MIKCGTIAAVVIAGSAAGTATLVSDPVGTERVAAGDHAVDEHALTARGTGSVVTAVGTFAPPVGGQPRRGERLEYEATPLAMASSSGDGIRRGIR